MKIHNGFLITLEELSCYVRRLEQAQYYALSQHAIAVEVDYLFWWEMERLCRAMPASFPNLAEFYVMFRAAFGASDDFFDEWKGAFAFAFTVDVFQDGRKIPYVLRVVNLRSSIEFQYKKVIAPGDTTYDRMRVYPPFAEFSQAQMGLLSTYLWGYAQGFWETCGAACRPFIKQVPANLIVFGYADGDFFEEQYQSQEEFDAAHKEWLRRHALGSGEGENQSCNITGATMQTALEMTPSPVYPAAPREATPCVLLPGISWKTYESLLADMQDSHAAHFAYDQGVLEIMVLSGRHELPREFLLLLVNIVAEERGIDVKGFGSTTFRRADLARGFEPDACFYIQNEDRVSSKNDIDLAIDPPPDLVIAIDITSPSLNKFPLFAALGVPEVWRYDGAQVAIFTLAGHDYVEGAESVALPPVTPAILTEFLRTSQRLKWTVWLRQLRAWVRSTMGSHESGTL